MPQPKAINSVNTGTQGLPQPPTMWSQVEFPLHSDDIRKVREGKLLKDWDVKRNCICQIMTSKLEEAAYTKGIILNWKDSFTFLDKLLFNRQFLNA